MFGKTGREIYGCVVSFPPFFASQDSDLPFVCSIAYFLLMTMIAGSALLGMATALNAISLHATCTAVFVAVAAVATFFPASMRTLGSVKWIGWIGLTSMVVSILLVVGAVGSGNRPSPAPQTGP